MNTQATLERMHQMKFYGMARAYQASVQQKTGEKIPIDTLIAHLIDSEWMDREQRKTSRHIRAAKFRYPASIEQIDYYSSRNLDKQQMLRLADCSYLGRGENIIITGPTGVGKSYIASAFGYQACHQGFKVRYFNFKNSFPGCICPKRITLT